VKFSFLADATRTAAWRQYSRLASTWTAGIDLDPALHVTHSLRKTKGTLIYRRTGNLRAVQLLLGHRRRVPSDTLGSRSMTPWPFAEQVEV
jgi:integrase